MEKKNPRLGAKQDIIQVLCSLFFVYGIADYFVYFDFYKSVSISAMPYVFLVVVIFTISFIALLLNICRKVFLYVVRVAGLSKRVSRESVHVSQGDDEERSS